MDPTLLLGNFSKEEEKIETKGYILVYTYGFTDKQIKLIKGFAKTKELRIVAAGVYYYKWCDENLPVSPFQFLTLVKNADYVITDTYHGTIFSTIYKKQFVVFTGRKIKVEQILRQLDLDNRIIDEDKDIDAIIDKEIDYLKVDSILAEKRRQSSEYLTNALNHSDR